MANRVNPDETAHYESSPQDLHCLQKNVFWSTGLKGLKQDQGLRQCSHLSHSSVLSFSLGDGLTLLKYC